MARLTEGGAGAARRRSPASRDAFQRAVGSGHVQRRAARRRAGPRAGRAGGRGRPVRALPHVDRSARSGRGAAARRRGRRSQGARTRGDRVGRAAGRGHRERPAGVPAAARSERRTRRDPRGARRRRRPGGEPVGGRADAHVHEVRRAARLEDRGPQHQRDRPGRHQRGHLRGARPRRVLAPEVGGRRTSRAARARDRDAGSHSYVRWRP